MSNIPEAHARIQEHHFKDADDARFNWQTGNSAIVEYERDLVAGVAAALPSGGSLLEVGSGEGANLVNLRGSVSPGRITGVDFSAARTAFWRANVANSGFIAEPEAVTADATSLPMPSNSFDVVFCRDLLHHIRYDLQSAVTQEMVRVCKPGGTVIVIEGCGRNPIIAAFAALAVAERGMFGNTTTRLRSLLEGAGGLNVHMEHREPLPLARVVFHYRYGAPALAGNRLARAIVRGTDALAARIVPKTAWAYLIATCRKPSVP